MLSWPEHVVRVRLLEEIYALKAAVLAGSAKIRSTLSLNRVLLVRLYHHRREDRTSHESPSGLWTTVRDPGDT